MSSKRHQRSRPSNPLGIRIAFLLVAAIGVALILWSQFAHVKQPASAPTVPATGAVAPPGRTLSIAPPDASPDALLPNDPVKLINLGKDMLGLGQLDKAVHLYTKALEINPDDEEGHFGLAVAYTKMGRTNDAVKHYEDALKIFADYPEVHNNLGNIYLAQRQHAKAIQHYLSALKVQPESTSAINNLGRALAEQGKMAEAVHYFQEALRLDTNYVEARFNLATALLRVGQLQSASNELNEILRQRPGFPPATQILARIQQNQATNKP